MCPPGGRIARRHLLCFPRIRSRMLSMQRATPWFVGPAIHGARAAQLFLRSRAHSRERARCAHTGAQQIDAQRSRLIAHSLSRLECRLPLMANTRPPTLRSGLSGKASGALVRAPRVLTRIPHPGLDPVVVDGLVDRLHAHVLQAEARQGKASERQRERERKRERERSPME